MVWATGDHQSRLITLVSHFLRVCPLAGSAYRRDRTMAELKGLKNKQGLARYMDETQNEMGSKKCFRRI